MKKPTSIVWDTDPAFPAAGKRFELAAQVRTDDGASVLDGAQISANILDQTGRPLWSGLITSRADMFSSSRSVAPLEEGYYWVVFDYAGDLVHAETRLTDTLEIGAGVVPTALTIGVDKPLVEVGDTVKVFGTLTRLDTNTGFSGTVSIFAKEPGGEDFDSFLGDAVSGSNGYYTLSFVPDLIGTWEVLAVFETIEMATVTSAPMTIVARE
ncbi:MAG: hypothetical protein PHZ19_11020 [Candidatus Thermoplasmatota archaeon]|nr:hypothetical protein [Candidatus Thermoplasmatota archaeon]